MVECWSLVICFIMGSTAPEKKAHPLKKKKKNAAHPVSMLLGSIFALKWFKCMWLWGCPFFQPDLLHWLGLVIEGERANQARKRIKRKNRRKWKLLLSPVGDILEVIRWCHICSAVHSVGESLHLPDRAILSFKNPQAFLLPLGRGNLLACD